MPRFLNLLRPSLHYRREQFEEGARRAGFDVVEQIGKPEPGDVLLIWNRYAGPDEMARGFEARGATVIVAENGYLGKDWQGEKWFALSVGHHAGAGRWPHLGPDRWDSWGVELQPWRDGPETVIFGQRGFGEEGVRAPELWAEGAQRRFGGRIRQHPGTGDATPLEQDLARSGRCVTWNSGAALKALIFGVPVFYEHDAWIGAPACRHVAGWKDEARDDAARLAMFRRLAWAMWTAEEVASGMAFSILLR